METVNGRSLAIGAAIARLRAARGWSFETLERRSGVPASTIHNLEAGKQRSTRLENVVALARAFDVQIDELLLAPAAAAPTDVVRTA